MTAFSLPVDDRLFRREWLVCNGLGGYAAGTVGGAPTRRYHGYLIAALPNPAGRVMMLNALVEGVRLTDGRRAELSGVGPTLAPADWRSDRIPLVEFALELGLPVWRFAGLGVTIERRVVASY